MAKNKSQRIKICQGESRQTRTRHDSENLSGKKNILEDPLEKLKILFIKRGKCRSSLAEHQLVQ